MEPHQLRGIVGGRSDGVRVASQGSLDSGRWWVAATVTSIIAGQTMATERGPAVSFGGRRPMDRMPRLLTLVRASA